MSDEAYKIGVYVCECGPNIADAVDIDRVIEVISTHPDVAVVKRHRLLCSVDGKDFLKQDIIDEGLTHVVVAACSPKDHEATFAGVCEEAGLNPYLYQLINIREQCAWMIKDKEAATDKTISYIRSGISRVFYHVPLEQKEIDSIPDVIVIGGGIAGIEAALSLASPVRKVHLVEKTDSLGGTAVELSGLLAHQGTNADIIHEKIRTARQNENIEIHLESEVTKSIGFFGNFEIEIKKGGDEIIELNVGAIIIATGFSMFNPAEDDRWGYGKIDNVFTALEIEKKAVTGEITLADGSAPKSAALVHCVGRDEVGYCSGICCNYLIRIAGNLKEKYPDIKINHLYRDLCVPNKNDQSYIENLREKGVEFNRTNDVTIAKGNGGIDVTYTAESGEKESLAVDMAILAPAMKPGVDTQTISKMLDITLDKTGFFEEEHLCLGPVGTAVDGVFIVGCAHGPKNIPDSIVQSHAASGSILSRLIPGRKLLPEIKVSEVLEVLCTGCQTCVTVCSYGAASFDEDKGVSVINEAICRGCGNCVGSCPSGAVRSKHFTTRQLHQEVIEAIINPALNE